MAVRRVALLVTLLALALGGCTARSRLLLGFDTPAPVQTFDIVLPGDTPAPGTTTDPNGGDQGDQGDQGDTGDQVDQGDPGDQLSFDPEASLVDAPQLQVQLVQFPNARVAGFFAADVQGFYDQYELDVLVNPADPSIDPTGEVMDPDNETQFLFAPALVVMKADEAGDDLVNIAQIYQRSGIHIASLSDAGITTASQLATLTKPLAVMPYGRDMDAVASLVAAGLNPSSLKTKVADPFDPTAFAGGDPIAAEVTYEDEYAQILETQNGQASGLITPDQVNLIDLTTAQYATLQEGIYASATWLAQPGNDQIAVRFLAAVMRGWIYCRDDLTDCAQTAYESGGDRPTQHQMWVLNEANALIWPSPNGIGVLDQNAWQQTAQLGINAGLLTAAPKPEETRSDLATAALGLLTDVETTGAGFTKTTVPITAGGEDPATP